MVADSRKVQLVGKCSGFPLRTAGDGGRDDMEDQGDTRLQRLRVHDGCPMAAHSTATEYDGRPPWAGRGRMDVRSGEGRDDARCGFRLVLSQAGRWRAGWP